MRRGRPCESLSLVTGSRHEHGDVGAGLGKRLRRRTRAAWLLACVVPGLLVQALESRGAAAGTLMSVEIGRPYKMGIEVHVKCHDSSCSSSGQARDISERVAGVVVMLDIVSDAGGQAYRSGPLPFVVGQEFVPPISGRVSLDFESQTDAKAAIQERGRSECDNLEVSRITLVDVTPLGE